MKKIILLILTVFITTQLKAQETPPTGLKAINSQFYIHLPDSSIWHQKGTPYGWERLARYKDIDGSGIDSPKFWKVGGNTNINNTTYVQSDYSDIIIGDRVTGKSALYLMNTIKATALTAYDAATFKGSSLGGNINEINLLLSANFGKLKALIIDTSKMELVDRWKNKGLVYSGNYEPNFTNKSLVTKRYVDSAIITGASSNSNIYKTDGTITAGRTVSLEDKSLTFAGNNGVVTGYITNGFGSFSANFINSSSQKASSIFNDPDFINLYLLDISNGNSNGFSFLPGTAEYYNSIDSTGIAYNDNIDTARLTDNYLPNVKKVKGMIQSYGERGVNSFSSNDGLGIISSVDNPTTMPRLNISVDTTFVETQSRALASYNNIMFSLSTKQASGTYLTPSSTNTVTNKDFSTGNTFPTFNQNTTGSAATLTTPRNINGVPFNGSANITITANATNALTLGYGLTGVSFNGSSAITATVDTAGGIMSKVRAAANYATISTVNLKASLTDTETLTNKRITARISTTTSNSTLTPAGDSNDQYNVTALAVNATFGAPSGTPTDGQALLLRIKDNGTARTLAWNSIYRASTDLALPSTTVTSKTMYVQFIYNAADTKWDCVGLTNGF